MRYTIKKTYLQLVQRAQRNLKRQQQLPQPSTASSLSNPSSKSHSFAILTSPDLDDSDSDNETGTFAPTSNYDPPGTITPTKQNTVDKCSVSSKFTQQATTLKRNMDDTLATISHNATAPTPLPSKTKKLITALVDEKFRTTQKNNDKHNSKLQETYSSLPKEMKYQQEILNTTNNTVQKQMDTLDTKISNLIQDSIHTANTLVDVQAKIEHLSAPHFQPTNDNLTVLQSQLQVDITASHSKLKK